MRPTRRALTALQLNAMFGEGGAELLDQIDVYPFDVDAAKAELAQSAYPDGFAIAINFAEYDSVVVPGPPGEPEGRSASPSTGKPVSAGAVLRRVRRDRPAAGHATDLHRLRLARPGGIAPQHPRCIQHVRATPAMSPSRN